MQILPIFERELRAKVHQPRTWWMRLNSIAVGLAVLVFVAMTMGRWMDYKAIGHSIFSGLAIFGMIYALLAGPLKTADCLSRERREGTLGLLFRTSLHGYDVVLGKMMAASFEAFLRLLAGLPLVAVPFLLGGLTLADFFLVVLGLVNALFFSVAVGASASSSCTSARASLGITLVVLTFLSLGLPWLGEGAFDISAGSTPAAFFYMLCPTYGLRLVLDRPALSEMWKLWLNLGALHGFAWGLVLFASLRLSCTWRERPASARIVRWRGHLARWRKGTVGWRLNRAILEQNPIAWLEGRTWLQPAVLWALIFVLIQFCVFAHFATLARPRGPLNQSWPDGDALILFSFFVHCGFCLWLAIQAPRRFADDKNSGALELLLCTTQKPADLVKGNLLALRRGFGAPLIGLMLLYLFLFYAYLDDRLGSNSTDRDTIVLALCGLVVFPLQAWSMMRVGLYQGLASANSIRATFMLVGKIGLLPWGLFFVGMCLLDFLFHGQVFGGTFADHLVFILWAAEHLVVFAIFVAHAHWQLRRNFRRLAAQTRPAPWWKRLFLLAPWAQLTATVTRERRHPCRPVSHSE